MKNKMKGYRVLKADEIIQEGDQAYSPGSRGWSKVFSFEVGKPADTAYRFRRPLPGASLKNWLKGGGKLVACHIDGALCVDDLVIRGANFSAADFNDSNGARWYVDMLQDGTTVTYCSAD